MIETVRISEKGKTQLITLKRRTGIQNWNVLCRWAFCISMKEDKEPPFEEIPADSSIEMTWKTFTGGDEELFYSLLKQRAFEAGVGDDREKLNKYFRLHLHRGISYMTGNTKLLKIEDLIRIAT